MTGSTSYDMAVIHAETLETFDKINSDKIAEAEALAAEALRMANEAKRAAERLAEVKKTLAMFSKKLDKNEKIFLTKKSDSTPVEADSVIVKKQEDAPVAEEPKIVEEESNVDTQVSIVVEEPKDEELPPPIDEEEEDFVPPPPPSAPVAAPMPMVEKATPPAIVLPMVEKAATPPALDLPKVEKAVDPAIELPKVEKADAPASDLPKVESAAAPAPVTPMVEKAAAPALVMPKVEKAAAPTPVETLEEEKDILEATLDDWGVDKMCGVDDVTLANIEAEEMGWSAPVVVTTKVTRSAKTASSPKKTVRVVAREPAPTPKVDRPVTEMQSLALSNDDGKDFFEKTLDSWGIDRLCGVDDVSLGYAQSLPEPPPPPKPVPFENPTRVEYKEIPALQLIHSESLKEQWSKEIREKEHLPQKSYQRAPTNYDFVDPFGVDHDDFAMCGRLADVCEPDFDALQQPVAYTITAAPAPVTLPEPEKSILKKETRNDDAPVDSVKNVSFQEAPGVVVTKNL